ncbi:hypothetical protein PROFUN_08546 [Planoprotostelium fungivorum]|uniref:Uncharacterized protein n=1 Tax=Planoprotostelium fungivorum TaxID=1890364 RepID=A0A2P6N1M5_9EUKA|nr:hypothetical protein PROFUN_08546 [Planoprotostelium fungivorum]
MVQGFKQSPFSDLQMWITRGDPGHFTADTADEFTHLSTASTPKETKELMMDDRRDHSPAKNGSGNPFLNFAVSVTVLGRSSWGHRLFTDASLQMIECDK